MTTDDFKHKCDEIHTIVCYLLDKELRKPFIGRYFVKIDGFEFKKAGVIELETLVCAIEIADGIKAYYNV